MVSSKCKQFWFCSVVISIAARSGEAFTCADLVQFLLVESRHLFLVKDATWKPVEWLLDNIDVRGSRFAEHHHSKWKIGNVFRSVINGNGSLAQQGKPSKSHLHRSPIFLRTFPTHKRLNNLCQLDPFALPFPSNRKSLPSSSWFLTMRGKKTTSRPLIVINKDYSSISYTPWNSSTSPSTPVSCVLAKIFSVLIPTYPQLIPWLKCAIRGGTMYLSSSVSVTQHSRSLPLTESSILVWSPETHTLNVFPN